MSQRIKGWHFDEHDTPQQRSILRTSRTAQWVRREFPAGTRVKSTAGRFGTVDRHIPGTSADGGTVIINWDNGSVGRHTMTSHAIVKVAKEVSDVR